MDSAPTQQEFAPRLSPPLVVDLDGTLIRTDMLWESFVRLVRRNPFYALLAIFWWMRGRANLKRQLGLRIQVEPARLPYHEPLLNHLRSERAAGRRLILATASDIQMARPVADHVGLFDEVFASDGKHNLRGNRKGYVLREKYGERGFDYAGNSTVDLAVWERAREAIVVNASPSLVELAQKVSKVGATFLERRRFAWWFIQSLRPQRWPKNLLACLPLLSLKYASSQQVNAAEWAVASFCACSAAAYLWNDLMDLDEDRAHPIRARRPLASGRLPLQVGLVGAPALAAVGIFTAALHSWGLVCALLAYLAGTFVYATRLKRYAPVAVLGLTGLNLLRIAGGFLAIGLHWTEALAPVPIMLCACLASIRYGFLRKGGVTKPD